MLQTLSTRSWATKNSQTMKKNRNTRRWRKTKERLTKWPKTLRMERLWKMSQGPKSNTDTTTNDKTKPTKRPTSQLNTSHSSNKHSSYRSMEWPIQVWVQHIRISTLHNRCSIKWMSALNHLCQFKLCIRLHLRRLSLHNKLLKEWAKSNWITKNKWKRWTKNELTCIK